MTHRPITITTWATDDPDYSQHELDQIYGEYPLPVGGQGQPQEMGGGH